MKNFNYRKYPEIIKDLRNEKGESQLQFAKKIDVSQSAVAKWELDKSEPTANALIKMSIHFNKTTDFILGLEDEWGNKIDINPTSTTPITPVTFSSEEEPKPRMIPVAARSRGNKIRNLELSEDEIRKIQASRIRKITDDDI